MIHENPWIQHDTSYPPARGPVLLLTCMDIRLLDEVVRFMDHDGQTNRYDHVILAGAALGALGGCRKEYAHWRDTFDDHLQIAYDLRHFKDVYIIEHRDCGAYAKMLGAEGTFGDSKGDQKREKECHRHYAKLLHQRIGVWAKLKADHTIRVKSFLMDLRGRVSLLRRSTYEWMPTDCQGGGP
jgi:hypothetical protein